MTGVEIKGIKLPPVEQVGIVVKDVEKAIDKFGSAFGWEFSDVSEVEMEGCMYMGKPSGCKLKMAFSKPDPIEIELIEVVDGETPHSEFLKNKGEGIQHLRYSIDDLDGKLVELKKQGIEPVWSHSYPEIGISFVYLDTVNACGVMIELIEIKEVQA